MPYTDSPDFVAGAAPPYKIQPTIDHPAYCVCPRHRDLPIGQRAIAESVRVLRKSIYPDDRRMSAVYALDVKRTLERELQEAARIAQPSKRMTLREICDLYFEMNPKKVSAATITRDRQNAANVCRVINELAPDAWPDEIDEPIAVRYRNAREREDAAQRTILNELSFLRMMLEFGLRWRRETGVESVRLAALPEIDEDDKREGVALTLQEFGAVLEVLAPINRRRFITAATTLLRRSPLLALRESWIEPEKKWLSVPAEVMKKGRSKKRAPLEVPLSEWTLDQVRDLDPIDGYYWPNPATKMPLAWIDHILDDVSSRVKIVRAGVRQKLRFHDLRYTGISWLRNAGVDELTVAILGGQRSTFDPMSETMSVRGGKNVTQLYTKLLAPTLREAVAVQDELRKKLSA